MAAAVAFPLASVERPPAALTLYDMHEHLTALLDTLDLVDTEEQRAEIERDIAAAVAVEVRKVDGICAYLAHLEAQQEFATAEIRRLQARKQAFASRQERLESYVQRVMESTGAAKLEGRTSTLALRKSPPSVAVDDAALIPEAYRVVKVEESVDKTKLKDALKLGVEVPGAHLVTDRKYLKRS